MGKTLIIIESPNKIKKLQEILGKNYIIKASVGHIMDLPKSKLGIDIDNDFKPDYDISPDKKKVVAELRKSAKDADTILLATDEDREGEMIAWSIMQTLNLKDTKRLVYNSITKKDVLDGLDKLRDLDMNMVDAAQTRRLLDRLVGYKISPILWTAIKMGISAGRVQSVVVKMIVERENEINEFLKSDINTYFKFYGYFKQSKSKDCFKTNLFKKDTRKIEQIDTDIKAKKFLEKCSKSKFTVSNIEDKIVFKGPSPPFDTFALQQESNRKLSMNVKRTSFAAQKLYEAGHITYIRTDSVNLSKEALKEIKKYVVDKYGSAYHRETKYKSKGTTQEAHEAIRPTHIEKLNLEDTNLGSDEKRLYLLIWKRAVASQMSPAKINKQTIQIDISEDNKRYFANTIETILFNGFLEVYNIKNAEEDEEEGGILKSSFKVGEKLNVSKIEGIQEYDKPASRYNEASLIQQMKSYDIGRPATIGQIISKIQERNYVEKKDTIKGGVEKDSLKLMFDGEKITEEERKVEIGGDKNKFVPTHLGIEVNNLLKKHFVKIMDYKFTGEMEKKLDDIVNDKISKLQVLQDFYGSFKPLLDKLNEDKSVIKKLYPKVLGTHNDKEIKLHFGRNGFFVSNGTKNADATETTTLEDAIKALNEKEGDKTFENEDTIYTVKHGRFGIYIQIMKGKTKTNVSLPKDTDIDSLTLEDIKKIVEEKKKTSILSFKDGKKTYNVLTGQYGTYIKVSEGKKKAVNIPYKNTDIKPENLTLEKIKELADKYYERRKNRFKKKPKLEQDDKTPKTPTKKTPKKKKVETKSELDD